jgi:hypothetical protein
MMPAEITLKLVWDFLSPVFGDRLKETIRKKGSPQVAKERVFRLYKSPGDVKARTFTFISALRLYASLIEEKASGERMQEAKDFLYDRTSELMRATTEMMDALESLSPQLEIHNYELYQTIKYFKGGRDAYGFDNASLDHDLDVALIDAEEGNSAELNRILAQENQSYESIDRCLAEFRASIIREIPFRESF